MGKTISIATTEFEATCLDLLDQLAAGEVARLEITKCGKVVAVVTSPKASNPLDGLYGAMKGCVIAPPGFDFTEPAFDGVMEAAEGRLLPDDA